MHQMDRTLIDFPSPGEGAVACQSQFERPRYVEASAFQSLTVSRSESAVV